MQVFSVELKILRWSVEQDKQLFSLLPLMQVLLKYFKKKNKLTKNSDKDCITQNIHHHSTSLHRDSFWLNFHIFFVFICYRFRNAKQYFHVNMIDYIFFNKIILKPRIMALQAKFMQSIFPEFSLTNTLMSY